MIGYSNQSDSYKGEFYGREGGDGQNLIGVLDKEGNIQIRGPSQLWIRKKRKLENEVSNKPNNIHELIDYDNFGLPKNGVEAGPGDQARLSK